MRTLLLSATIGLIVFGIADEAQAQRGGGQGWGGGNRGTGSGWGGWGGSGYNYGRAFGYGGYNYNPYWGGYGTRGYGYGYGNYGYGNPYFSFYRFPGYATTYRSYSNYNNTYAYPNYYQAPANVDYSNAPRQLANDESIVLVRVPDPNATVVIDGQATSQTGTERVFHTPKLEPGYTYSYTISASFSRDGGQVQEQRTVQVVPGQPTFVDFTTEQPVIPPK